MTIDSRPDPSRLPGRIGDDPVARPQGLRAPSTAGWREDSIRHAVRPCSLGQVLVAATGAGVCMVAFDDGTAPLEAAMRARFSGATFVDARGAGDPRFEAWVAGVLHAIARPREGADLPLDIRGTAFQQTVWQALRAISPGATESYSAVAGRIGRPGAARAVAGACAGNAIALLVPCHRVVRGDGHPGGFRWGIERKRMMLERERA